ncbi:hypothetical protein C815_02337, partial [Firmicutes bacterium M10-2]
LIKSLRKAIKRIVAFNIELMKENDDLIDELKVFVEIQEDDNVLGYAYMRLMQLKSKG